jgi:hypothetical protein
MQLISHAIASHDFGAQTVGPFGGRLYFRLPGRA